MKSHSSKPLGYYVSDSRNEAMLRAIALEYGDHFEQFTVNQRREALILVAIAYSSNSFASAIDTYTCSISSLTVPRNFCAISMELNQDGWLALSIALAHSLRDKT